MSEVVSLKIEEQVRAMQHLPGPGFRVIIPVRLSKDVQGQTGIDSQDMLATEYAKGHQWSVVQVIPDKVPGPVQPWKRKNLKPWATKVELMGQYDGILGLSFDRLSRGDDASTAEIEKWARDNGKMFLTVDGLYYPCEGEDGIRWDLAKRLAHAEWMRTSERYRRMHSYLRSENKLVSKPPWGFIVVPDDGHKTLAVDPELEPFLVAIIQRVLRGDTFSSICRWLDAEGIEPKYGGKWHTKSLTQVLRNPCLKGRQVNARGKTILRFQGLINAREFDQLQDALSNRPNKRGPVKGQTAMLTNVVFCAKCKRPLYRFRTHNTHKDGSKHIKHYYRCKGSDQEPSTCRVMVPGPLLEDWVNQWFTIGASEGGAFGDTEIIETLVVPGHGYEDEIADVEAELRELDYDDPEFAAKQSELLAERKRLKELPTVPAETLERPTGILVKDHWRTLDDQGKRRYMLAADIKVYAEMKWRDEKDREARKPGRLSPYITGDPHRVIGALQRS